MIRPGDYVYAPLTIDDAEAPSLACVRRVMGKVALLDFCGNAMPDAQLVPLAWLTPAPDAESGDRTYAAIPPEDRSERRETWPM